MESSEHEHCGELLDALSAYLDGELDAESSRRIEAHLADCSLCLRFVASLKNSIALSKGFRPPAVPGSLPESFKAELLEAYRKSRRQSPAPGTA